MGRSRRRIDRSAHTCASTQKEGPPEDGPMVPRRAPTGRRRHSSASRLPRQRQSYRERRAGSNHLEVGDVNRCRSAIESLPGARISQKKEPANRHGRRHIAFCPCRLVQEAIRRCIELPNEPISIGRSHGTQRHDDARFPIPARTRENDHRTHLHHLGRLKSRGEVAEQDHPFGWNERYRPPWSPYRSAAFRAENVLVVRFRNRIAIPPDGSAPDCPVRVQIDADLVARPLRALERRMPGVGRAPQRHRGRALHASTLAEAVNRVVAAMLPFGDEFAERSLGLPDAVSA
jgi:hypothetical protein